MTPADTVQLLKDVCLHVVDRPTMLRVESHCAAGVCQYTVAAHAADCRRLIGQRGASFFQGLVAIVNAAGAGEPERYRLLPIIESGGLKTEPLTSFRQDPRWHHAKFKGIMDRVFALFFGHDLRTRLDVANATGVYTICPAHCYTDETKEIVNKAISPLVEAVATGFGAVVTIDFQ